MGSGSAFVFKFNEASVFERPRNKGEVADAPDAAATFELPGREFAAGDCSAADDRMGMGLVDSDA